MKYFKSIMLGLGMIVILGCSTTPDAPVLISPEDGEIFDSLPPTFMWNSMDITDGYTIVVATDTLSQFYNIYKELDDTTYTIPQNIYDQLINDTYLWSVGSRLIKEGDISFTWSEWHSFVVDRIIDHPITIDLDTTYYPYGLGYEWCYQGHSWVHDCYPWDRYSTSISKVTDSFWIEDTLVFETNYTGYVKFWEDKVNGVELYPEPDTTPIEGGEYRVYYIGDSILIKEEYAEAPEGSPPDVWHSGETRLKGVGLLNSGSSWSGTGDYSSGSSTGLLYFYNGQDTIYKAE